MKFLQHAPCLFEGKAVGHAQPLYDLSVEKTATRQRGRMTILRSPQCRPKTKVTGVKLAGWDPLTQQSSRSPNRTHMLRTRDTGVSSILNTILAAHWQFRLSDDDQEPNSPRLANAAPCPIPPPFIVTPPGLRVERSGLFYLSTQYMVRRLPRVTEASGGAYASPWPIGRRARTRCTHPRAARRTRIGSRSAGSSPS